MSEYPQLKDSFGRIAKKLRISVTDKCNMRCVYCMPYNNTDWIKQDNLLSYSQIFRLVKIFTSLGIEIIKITGGEPTVRKDIEKLIKSISLIPEIRSVSMTTNGLLLKDKIKKLKESGLQNVNISLDTFDSSRFKSMTGTNNLDTVIDSIKTAKSEGLKVKINTVIMRGWNDDEISSFVDFSRESNLTVKFIEFMPLDGTGIWKDDLVVSKREMIERIETDFSKLIPLNIDKSDPARLYTFEDGLGTIGFIPSITEPFCQSCDRVRITSEGKLYSCLFDDSSYDLKKLLDEGKSDDEISSFIKTTMYKKPEGIVKIIKLRNLKSSMNNMYSIGG
ncbi:MAG: GTP 3',8-cyclase MoaA [Candidatus Nitrosocosmicus sp.]|nr:GTP 3',8-cyclase MoaA [Candidatus Nitrosocosmicus sp.]